jgi:hypothetical protein
MLANKYYPLGEKLKTYLGTFNKYYTSEQSTFERAAPTMGLAIPNGVLF